MYQVTFGSDKRKLSGVMLGLMRIDKMSVQEVSELLHAALELGINCIDLADIYGGGKCEQLVGEVFANEPALREQFFVQTKVGIHRDTPISYFDFSEDYIYNATKASLERLQLNYVDALLLHRPDVLMDPAEVDRAFDRLYAEDRVRQFGVSNQNVSTMRRLQRGCSHQLVANQVQLSCAFAPAFQSIMNANMENEPSIMHEDGIFEYAIEKGQVIQAWSSFQYGYFEGTFLYNDKFAQLNDVLEEIAVQKGVSRAAIALAWILRFPAKMQAIVGCVSLKHLTEAAQALHVELTRKEWYMIYLAAGRQLP